MYWYLHYLVVSSTRGIPEIRQQSKVCGPCLPDSTGVVSCANP